MSADILEVIEYGNESEAGIGLGIPSGVKVMGAHLQRKFARGVQYNMKVIIKGERNTGKSTLLYRLQGYKFVPEYNATDEIQVAVIHWTAATSDEVVKVDIWDIVDKGKNKKKAAVGLKLSNDPSEDNSLMDSCLDADFLDVYQGTHAVIFTFDITKKWTYDYVIKNLPLVPHEIPVLVMANFMDNQENRVVTENSGMRLLRSAANRPLVGAPVVVIESSLKNGFGLKMVHQFLNLPFLSLQRKSLHQMLESNKANQIKMNNFFQTIDDNKDCDYGMFLQRLEDRKSSPEKSMSPSNSAIINSALPASNNGDSSTNISSPGKRNEETDPSQNAVANAQTGDTVGNREGFGSKLTRMFSRRQKGASQAAKADPSQADNLDSFLSDDKEGVENGAKRTNHTGDDDSDEGNGNPMVEDFYEDFASDENCVFEVDLEAYHKEEKLVDLSSKKEPTVKNRRKISTASEDEPETVHNETLPNQEPEIVFVSEEPSPTMSPKRKNSKSVKKNQKHQSRVDSVDRNSAVDSSRSSSTRRTKKLPSNRAKKQFKNKRLQSSGSSNSGSSETSEGGDIPQNGSEVDPTSEDPEGDLEFKSFIEKQNEVQSVAEQSNVSRKSKYSKMNPKLPKGNLINETSSSDSENELVSLEVNDHEQKMKEKRNGAIQYGGRVPTRDSEEIKSNLASSNEGTLFLSEKDSDTSPRSDVINPINVSQLSWENSVSMESSKGMDKVPIITPQSSVAVDGDSTSNPISPTALNLTFNTGDLDFLEAAALSPQKDVTKQSDSLVPKEKKSKKKSQSNDADSVDVVEREKKKSKKTKSKSRRRDENEVEDSPGTVAADVKSSKKGNKEQLVLLELEDPELDDTLIAADNIGDYAHDLLGNDKSEDVEKRQSKPRKSDKVKKKKSKDSNAVDSEKTSNKKKRSSIKQPENVDTDSSAANECLPQEQQYHKNDGYESL